MARDRPWSLAAERGVRRHQCRTGAHPRRSSARRRMITGQGERMDPTLAQIITFLSKSRVRATYGAVAESSGSYRGRWVPASVRTILKRLGS
jgi:hypothetical protein